MFTVRYTNSRRDIFAFCIHHYLRSPAFLGFHAICLVFVTYAIYTSLPKDASLVAKAIIFGLLFLIPILFLTAVFLGSIALYVFSKKNKTFLTEHTITLRDDGFCEETVYNTSEHKWTIVQRLRRSKTHIYIYIAAHLAHLVPRRAFSSEAEWDAFYKFCKNRIENARQHLANPQ